MRVLVVEDETSLSEQLVGCAGRRGLCRRLRGRRRARRLPRAHRRLRRGRARSRIASRRRPHGAQRLAPFRACRPRSRAHRSRQLARDGPRHRRRRGRLRVEAVQDGGGARPAARAHSAVERAAAAGHPVRRRDARSATGPGDARWRAGQADEPRVPRALVPDAPSHSRRVAERADRAHLRAGLRPRLEHRRSVHRAPSTQARRVDHRDRPRPGIPRRRHEETLSLRGRLLFGTRALDDRTGHRGERRC